MEGNKHNISTISKINSLIKKESKNRTDYKKFLFELKKLTKELTF